LLALSVAENNWPFSITVLLDKFLVFSFTITFTLLKTNLQFYVQENKLSLQICKDLSIHRPKTDGVNALIELCLLFSSFYYTNVSFYNHTNL
jgi:hypothetical protein